MTERILVPFEGEGAGVEELTWGQHHIWLEMDAAGSSLNMGATRVLAEGTTINELAEEFRFYMCRYESMRTRLVFTDGTRPTQVVAGAGEVPLDLVEAGDADPATVAETVANHHREKNFDYVNEWPARMAVVCRKGVPTHMVMTLCHLVTDAAGAMVMFNDYQNRDPATGKAREEVAIQPAELARRQRTPPERRRSDASLRYWEDLIRAIPPWRFVEPVEKPETRYWQGWFTSPAMHLGLRAAAERTRTDTSAALLAAFSMAMVRVTGNNPAVMRIVTSNRFRPGFADIVAPMSQFGLCVVDVAGLTFDEAIHQARRRGMSANKHAYYDMAALAELLETVARDRGQQIDISAFFNDRRMQTQPGGEAPTPDSSAAAAAAMRAALPLTTLRWEPQTRLSGPHLMLHINDAPEAVVIFAEVDAHHLSLTDLEAILRSMEALSVGSPTADRGADVPTSGNVGATINMGGQ